MSARRSEYFEKKCAAKYVDLARNVAASRSMEFSREIAQMDADALRDLASTLFAQLAERDTAHATILAKRDAELRTKQLKIDQLTHEMAILKRWRFDRRSEQLDVVQHSLLDESIEADIEAIGLELEVLREKPATAPKQK